MTLVGLLCMLFLPLMAMSFQDPMQPPAAVQEIDEDEPASERRTQAGTFVVSHILFSNKRRLAVVNGKEVREGDILGAARIRKIAPQYIIIDRNGSRLRVPLLPKKIRAQY